jgi:hypothetical protein
LIVGEYTVFPIENPLRNLRIHSFGWRIHKLIVGEYTVFPIENPLRNLRIHSFRWRIHKLIVGEYTVFPTGNPLRKSRIHNFGWRIHELIVGEYTVFTIGNPLRNLRIHRFLVENTQVDCWRIHSFHYRNSLKELENTQFLGGEYTHRFLANIQFFTVGNPLRKSRTHRFWVENTQVDCRRLHSFHYKKPLKEIETTQFLVENTQVDCCQKCLLSSLNWVARLQ